VLHKTIHKYTVRAKQGGSQSRADNKSGGSGPKSAGASLRRHNELSLTNVSIFFASSSSCQFENFFFKGSSVFSMF